MTRRISPDTRMTRKLRESARPSQTVSSESRGAFWNSERTTGIKDQSAKSSAMNPIRIPTTKTGQEHQRPFGSLQGAVEGIVVFGHTERQQINRGNDRDSGNASDRGTRFSALINLHQPNNQGGRDQPRDQGQPLKRLAGAAREVSARQGASHRARDNEENSPGP